MGGGGRAGGGGVRGGLFRLRCMVSMLMEHISSLKQFGKRSEMFSRDLDLEGRK